MDILTSKHGRDFGLGHEMGSSGRALINRGPFVAGVHGSQMAYGSPGFVAFNDDFIGDALDARWNIVEGTDSATSDAAILAGGIGGVLRFTTGDAGTGLAADMIQMTQALQWQASNGNLFIEARFKLSAITTCYCFFGFTDLVTLEAPIESAASADTLTSNATDAVGFMFDTRMSTDNWWLVGVKADTDATAQNSTYAPVADTYEVLRIELNTDGEAFFYRNGILVGSKMAAAITAGTDLTPTFNISKTSVAASMTADMDYIAIGMQR
jgi:hypothetical protein